MSAVLTLLASENISRLVASWGLGSQCYYILNFMRPRKLPASVSVSCSLCAKHHEVHCFTASVVLGVFCVCFFVVVVVVAAVVVTDFYRLLTSSMWAKAVIQFGVGFEDFTPQCPL